MLIKLKNHVGQLQEFHRDWDNCQLCKIGTYARSHVQYELSPENVRRVDIFFIGEAPGQDEDKQGTPFVGDAGRFLRRAIKDSGCANIPYLITNTVACRPSEGTYAANRQPNWKEQSNCLPRLLKLVELFKPRTVILLGNIAKETWDSLVSYVFYEDNKYTKEFRNFVRQIKYEHLRHPSYLLRNNYTESQYQAYVSHLREAKDFVNWIKEQEENEI